MMTKCKFCKEPAAIKIQMANYCGVECAYKQARKLQEQAKKRKEVKDNRLNAERKKALKTRAEWLKDAQSVFNRFIRLRDEAQPCISCQRHHLGQYHAGHYLTVGACPELRFNELNVNKQCAPCNNHLSGNLINYRTHLLVKIGPKSLAALEGKHEPLKLTIEQIKELIATYKAKIKGHPTSN